MTASVTTSADSSPHWIGNVISHGAVARIIGISVLSALISATLPLLYNALLLEGRLDAGQIGIAATVELTATGLVAAIALSYLRPTHLRPVVGAAIVIFGLANLATAELPAAGIFVARAISGAASGIFMWLLVGMFARSTLPARMNGLFLAIQGGAGMVVIAVFANLILPQIGARGGFVTLALLSAIALVASFGLPRSYSPIATAAEGQSLRVPARGWLAVISAFLTIAAITAGWIYLPPLAAQLGHGDAVTRIGAPLALGMEVAGGLTAAALASTLSCRIAVPAAILIFACLLAAMALAAGPVVAIAALALYGFLWMFVVPFQFSHTIEVDPSRATLMILSPAQLLGSGFGPAVASFGVIGGNVRGAILAAIGMFAISLLLFFVSFLAKGRYPSVTPAASSREDLI